MTVYVLRNGDERAGTHEEPWYVKIGHTDEPEPADRVSDLQVGNPYELLIVGAVPGGKLVEGRLHRQYESRRRRGEWFVLSQAEAEAVLLDAIALVRVETAFSEVVEVCDKWGVCKLGVNCSRPGGNGFPTVAIPRTCSCSLPALVEVDACRRWITLSAKPTSYWAANSGALRSFAESYWFSEARAALRAGQPEPWSGHIDNGSFIVAALLEGLEMRGSRMGPPLADFRLRDIRGT